MKLRKAEYSAEVNALPESEPHVQDQATPPQAFDDDEPSFPPSPVAKEATQVDSIPAPVVEQPPHKPRSTRPADFENLAARKSFAGRLVEHGEAPYNHDPMESMSYFVVYEDKDGQQHKRWGKDLQNAIAEKELKVGDYIQIDFLGAQNVQVPNWRKDAQGKWATDGNGKRIQDGWKDEKLNLWRANKVDKEFCETFTPPASAPRKTKDDTTSLPASAASSGFRKNASPKNLDQSNPMDPSMDARQRGMAPQGGVPVAAGRSSIGQALGSWMTGLHNAGRSVVNGLNGTTARAKADQEKMEQHEQLLSAVRHSADRVSAIARTLSSGPLSSTLDEMKSRGLSAEDVMNSNQHPELKNQYASAMNTPEGKALSVQLDELDFYVDRAAKHGKEHGINVQPQLDDTLDAVKADTEGLAVNKNGTWKSVASLVEQMIDKVRELIRQIFERLTPGK